MYLYICIISIFMDALQLSVLISEISQGENSQAQEGHHWNHLWCWSHGFRGATSGQGATSGLNRRLVGVYIRVGVGGYKHIRSTRRMRNMNLIYLRHHLENMKKTDWIFTI